VYQADVYVGDLESGGSKMSAPRRLTLDERNDRAGCWTPDSRAVVFASDRGGTLDIYKQDVDKTTPELLVGSPDDDYGPRLSPDGQWVLYMTAKAGTGGQTPRVMRVPAGGGSPESVLTPRTANVNFRCSLPPGKLCILLEREGNRTTVTELGAVQGRGKELFTVDFTVGPVDVCPGGECILIALLREQQSRVGIFSLDGKLQRSFDVSGVAAVRGLDAAPDGRSIFVGSWNPETGGVVVRSDLQGRSRQLWQQKGSLNAYGIPSPDGRRVALLGTTAERNVWLAENF